MKMLILPALLPFALASMLSAQTCLEVMRDASGWIVQTIESQKQAGGHGRRDSPRCFRTPYGHQLG